MFQTQFLSNHLLAKALQELLTAIEREERWNRFYRSISQRQLNTTENLLSRAALSVIEQVEAKGDESTADEIIGEENLEKNVERSKRGNWKGRGATIGDLGNEVAEREQLCGNKSGCPRTMRSLQGSL